ARGIARNTVQWAVGEALPVKFWWAGFAQQYCTSRLQARDEDARCSGRRWTGQHGPPTSWPARHCSELLHRDGHAIDRAKRFAAGPPVCGSLCRCKRTRLIEEGEGISLFLDRLRVGHGRPRNVNWR